MLGVFGVEPVAEAVYRAVLDDPSASILAIAQAMGLPVERIRREVEVLARLGLVELGRVHDEVHACPPDLAVEMLIAREEHGLRARQREVTGVRENLGPLVDSFLARRTRGDSEGSVEVFDDRATTTSGVSQLVQSAHTRVAYMLTATGSSAGCAALFSRICGRLLGRGLVVRSILATGACASEPWKQDYLAHLDHGLQSRSHPAPAVSLVVVDGLDAAIIRDDGEAAHVLHGCELIAPLSALFEQTWHEAIPLVAMNFRSSSGSASDPRIRLVVSMLAQGHTDEVIARRLGVSARTIRRLVATALENLHADSRFQAGALAVKCGWVT